MFALIAALVSLLIFAATQSKDQNTKYIAIGGAVIVSIIGLVTIKSTNNTNNSASNGGIIINENTGIINKSDNSNK